MATLPQLSASSSSILAAGYSGGSYHSSQLMIGFPETFKCVGLFNGGMSSQPFRKSEYTTAAAGKTGEDAMYAETKRLIEE